MTTNEITVERKDHAATLCFCRPGGMNLLDTGFLEGILAALSKLGQDPGVRVIVITGRGNFCAGADIKELSAKTPAQARVFAELGHSVCSAIEQMAKPVIAAVSGHALGGGCELALACDLRIAAEDSRWGLPELNLGLIPGFGGTQRLPRLIGPAMAKELIFTGSIIGAKEAHAAGLVNRVVPASGLLESAMETAGSISDKSPLMLKAAKRLVNLAADPGSGLRMEISAFSECFSTEDHREGIQAFLSKRLPDFGGR